MLANLFKRLPKPFVFGWWVRILGLTQIHRCWIFESFFPYFFGESWRFGFQTWCSLCGSRNCLRCWCFSHVCSVFLRWLIKQLKRLHRPGRKATRVTVWFCEMSCACFSKTTFVFLYTTDRINNADVSELSDWNVHEILWKRTKCGRLLKGMGLLWIFD